MEQQPEAEESTTQQIAVPEQDGSQAPEEGQVAAQGTQTSNNPLLHHAHAPTTPSPLVDPTRSANTAEPTGSRPAPSGPPKASKPRESNAQLREQLLREKLEKEKERVRQKNAREKRKADRQAKMERNRQVQEQRRMQAQDIHSESRNYRQLAEARVAFARAQVNNPPEESSSDSSDMEEYEDLPGEEPFLYYFKEPREHSPDKMELMSQVIGTEKDSINQVNQELLRAEGALGEGVLPEGEDMEELLDLYQNVMQRITFLCHTQGKFAQLRNLKRAEALLELDQDLKQRAEGLLQQVGRLRATRQRERRDRRQNRTRRLHSTPGEATGLLPPTSTRPGRRSLSASHTEPRRPSHGDSGGPAGQGDQADNTFTYSSMGRPPPEHRGAAFGTFLPGNPSYYNGSSNGRGQTTNNSQQANNGHNASNGHAYHSPQDGGFGTQSHTQGSHRYIPYYLRINGEGATFYTTLPAPWNVLPEHVHTPLTQVPTMLKAGCFTEFSGAIQSYRTFRGSFLTGCHMLDLPITTKYMILKGCLERNLVLTDLLNTTEPSPQGYRTIILTLEERFGHGGVLLNYHLQRLTELPRVRETSLEDIDLLVDTARGYEAARLANGATNAHDPTYFNLVKNKLTDRLRREYARYCRENHISPTSCT